MASGEEPDRSGRGCWSPAAGATSTWPEGAPEGKTRRGLSTFRRGLSISALPVCLVGDHPEKEGLMKYMLLIHQGDTPTPRSPEAWATLSEDEQKAVYADYQAVNQTPGVTSCSRQTTSTRRLSWPRGSRRPAWAARSRCVRSWSGSDPRPGLPRPVGTGPGCTDRLPRRLRSRRGSRA